MGDTRDTLKRDRTRVKIASVHILHGSPFVVVVVDDGDPDHEHRVMNSLFSANKFP